MSLVTNDSSLHQRRRPLTDQELDAIPWIHLLEARERERAQDDLRIADASPGDYVCRVGRPVTYWFGVVDGLLKMSTDNAQGQTMTFTECRLAAGLVKARHSSGRATATTFRRCARAASPACMSIPFIGCWTIRLASTAL